jgi:hypothetical protein
MANAIPTGSGASGVRGTASIQSVTTFTATITNPAFLVAPSTGGITALSSGGVLIKGIKLEDTFLTSNQLVDTSKRVPLIDGSTVGLVNGVTSGTLTFRCVRVGQTFASGDLPTVASVLQKAGVTTASTIVVSYTIGGVTEQWTFSDSLLVKVPPLNLSGNDIAVYEVVFSYDDYSRS